MPARPRKICHVWLASFAPPNTELDFSAESIICLVGPEAHCNDMVQAQRPDTPIIRSSLLTQTGMVDFIPGRAVIEATQRKRVKYEANIENGEGKHEGSASSYYGSQSVVIKKCQSVPPRAKLSGSAPVHIPGDDDTLLFTALTA
ncbi:hypothetical protein Tco_0934480 [Tanacetum coccineum]